jgi:hypothetical protein
VRFLSLSLRLSLFLSLWAGRPKAGRPEAALAESTRRRMTVKSTDRLFLTVSQQMASTEPI